MTNFTPRNFARIERHGGALKVLCAALSLLSLIVLTACSGGKPSKDFYLRVTVDATYNGKAVGGSSVIKQTLINSAPRGNTCLLYTSPSPRDATLSRMPSSA